MFYFILFMFFVAVTAIAGTAMYTKLSAGKYIRSMLWAIAAASSMTTTAIMFTIFLI